MLAKEIHAEIVKTRDLTSNCSNTIECKHLIPILLCEVKKKWYIIKINLENCPEKILILKFGSLQGSICGILNGAHRISVKVVFRTIHVIVYRVFHEL